MPRETVERRHFLGYCERCDKSLYFPPWPRIVFRDPKPNGIICKTCVYPGEPTGPPATIEMRDMTMRRLHNKGCSK